MKKVIVLVLLVVVAGAAVFFYMQAQKQQREADALRQLQADMLAQEQNEAETRETLLKQVLEAPASCAGLTTAFVYTTCDNEPDQGWPQWKNYANDAEQACMVDTLYRTNAHAFAIQGKEYTAPAPSNDSVARLILDLCSASLFTDGIDYGDTDKPVSKLIDGYYAERATSIFKPGHDY